MATDTLTTLSNLFKQHYGPHINSLYGFETAVERKARLKREKNLKLIKELMGVKDEKNT